MQKLMTKSTENALRWLTLTTFLLLAINLTACSSIKRVEIVAKPVDRTKLALLDPAPIKTKPFQWVVITPQNAEEVFAKMQERNENLVLFALADDGYKSLSLNIAEVRNFMNTQRQMILQYKEYYEKPQDAKK